MSVVCHLCLACCPCLWLSPMSVVVAYVCGCLYIHGSPSVLGGEEHVGQFVVCGSIRSHLQLLLQQQVHLQRRLTLANTTTCNLTNNSTMCNLRNNWRLALASITTSNLTNNSTMCNLRNNWRLALATCNLKKQLETHPGKQNNVQSNNQSFSQTKWSGVNYSINYDMNKLISQKNNCLKTG